MNVITNIQGYDDRTTLSRRKSVDWMVVVGEHRHGFPLFLELVQTFICAHMHFLMIFGALKTVKNIGAFLSATPKYASARKLSW